MAGNPGRGTAGKAQGSVYELLPQHAVLLDEAGDDARLIAADDTREREHEQAERVTVA